VETRRNFKGFLDSCRPAETTLVFAILESTLNVRSRWNAGESARRLRRQVIPVVITGIEFSGNFLQKDRFVIRIVEASRIFLTGGGDDIAQIFVV